MSIVRKNLMEQKGYTPYCGSDTCKTMPRTKFNGKQFECPHCEWQSQFPEEFIQQYTEQWKLKL